MTQSDFAAALLDPGKPAPEGVPHGRRFDIYRNNVTVSLTEALIDGFPVIAKLLGTDNMAPLARLYLRAHPPDSPLMMHYGAGFPDFLAAEPQLAHLGYLPDTARLELALRRAYHAADAAPIEPAKLAALPADALLDTRLTLAPAVQLIRSPWPIHDIWRFNTQDDAPKPRAEAQDVLITRPEYDPEPHLLPPGAPTWIAALMQGASFGEALDAAQTDIPDFDLGTSLALLVQGNAITSLTPKEALP